jgi:cell division protein FtsI (penicillin-binding protein 3)
VSPAAQRQLRIQLAGKRQAQLARSRQRLMIGIMLFTALVGIIGLRLGELSLTGSSAVAATRQVAFAPPRADIVDRNGGDLATTFDAFALAVRPQALVGDPEILARRIANILGRPSALPIYKELTHHGKYRYIQRRILPAEAKAINAIGEPGLVLEREQERIYPNQFLAAHVIGYTNVDGVGQAGMERAYQERLTDPELRDKPLELAIDARVQHAVESELQTAMTKHSAIGASGIVLDVHTGEVLALASLPELNPNKAGAVSPDAIFNRATLGVYELGSTFKALTMGMALDTGVVTSMSQQYDATHPLQMGRFRIRDDHPKARWLTMTVSYGHGIAVTPLHLASAYAALVNGGVWRPATLLKVQGGGVGKGRRVFSEEASRTMRAMLRLVVTHGTGKQAEAQGYRVGGKTGTAEKPDGGRYNRNAMVTTFAGAFPMDDPKYVVIAMLDEPKGTKETYGFRGAGWNAAPVVSKVISRIAPVLGVAPSDVRDVDLNPLLAYVQGKQPTG